MAYSGKCRSHVRTLTGLVMTGTCGSCHTRQEEQGWNKMTQQIEKTDVDTLGEIGVIEDMDVFDLLVGENEGFKRDISLFRTV